MRHLVIIDIVFTFSTSWLIHYYIDSFFYFIYAFIHRIIIYISTYVPVCVTVNTLSTLSYSAVYLFTVK